MARRFAVNPLGNFPCVVRASQADIRKWQDIGIHIVLFGRSRYVAFNIARAPAVATVERGERRRVAVGYLSFENLYEIKEEDEEEGKSEMKGRREKVTACSAWFSSIDLDKSKTASMFSLNSNDVNHQLKYARRSFPLSFQPPSLLFFFCLPFFSLSRLFLVFFRAIGQCKHMHTDPRKCVLAMFDRTEMEEY